MKTTQKKQVLKTVMISTLAVSTVGCSHHNMIACHGLTTVDGAPYVIMDAGLCTKLAGGNPQPLPAGVKPAKTDDNDYVMCYGVAASGQNDCGTKTTACAGTIKEAKNPTAWVAALEGVCKQIGGRVGAIQTKK